MRVLFFSFILLFSQFLSASDLILAKQIKLTSSALGEERNMLIKLPKNYHDSATLYPVLYVLHGQWDTLPTLSTLDLLEGQTPEFIVVGIEGRGSELFPDSGKTTPFANYLTQEVVPYINENYRAAPYNILSGHSNAGRFVLDYWLNHNSPFSQYFAFSPSLDDGYLVDAVTKTQAAGLKQKKPPIITIANEGEHMQTPFNKLTENLNGIYADTFKFKRLPEQSHRTTKHPSMQYALQSTFTGWEPSYEVKVSGLDALEGHYNELTKKFGFKVTIPNETLQRLTAHYAISDDPGAQEELNKHIIFAIEQTPEGIDALFEISNYLTNNGYENAGDRILKKVCKQAKNNQHCIN